MSLEEHKAKFDRYAELKQQAKEIDAELKEMQNSLISVMNEVGVDKIEHGLGSFTLATRKVWKYSDSLEAERERLKAREKTEKAEGTATYNEVPQLTFRENRSQA